MRRAIYCAALAGMGIFMPGCPDGGGPDSLRVSPSTLHLEVGQRGTLRAESSAAGDRFTWTSSADGVASVTASGEVTALAVGTAQIRAVSAETELADTAAVTVTENLPPALSLSAPEPAATTTGPVTFTLTYDGASAITLAEADVSLAATGSAAAGTVTIAGDGDTTRTITLDGLTGDGTLTLSIAPGTATDTEGNAAPAAGPSEAVEVDNIAPGLEISGPSAALTRTGPVDYQINYTGADAITLATGDVLVNGTGTAAATLADVATTSESERTVSFANINGDGTLGISIAQGTATDRAGNAAPAAGPSAEVVVDNTPPTATIGAPYPATTNDGPVSFRVTYEGASAITLAEADIDINTTGAVVAVFDTIEVTSDTVRTVRFSMVAGDGTLGIALRAGTAVDEAGNEAPATDPGPTVTVDNTAPQVVIGPPSTASTSAGPVVYRVTYTGADEVTLDRDNVTLNTTGTAGAFISEVADVGEGRYDITLGTVIGNGTLGISLPEGTATDDAGNAAPAAGPSDTLNVANAGPTLLIGRPTTANTFGDPVSYTITYADAATITLAPADITLVSDDGVTATASVTGGGTTQRTVTLGSFSGLGDVAITLAANTAQDAGANPAPAAGPGEGFRVNPLLEPGSGFTGPTPQPDPIGAPGAPGIDAKAIARWDVVPYQTFDGYFEIGVVAFHINDIDRVEFSVEGGPWTAVREMTLNPLTDVVEYWVGLDARDFEDGPIEVRAVAYPKVGVPRVLGGEIGDGNSIQRGVYSLIMWSNSGGTLGHLEIYVDSQAGDDLSGDGTLVKPYRSIAKASLEGVGRALGSDGVTVRLMPGEYVLGAKLGVLKALEKWTTIEPVSGFESSDVVIVGSDTGALGLDRVCFRGLSIVGKVRLPFNSIWIDDVDVDGKDLVTNFTHISPAWSPGGVWVTGGTSTGSKNVLRDADFYRDHRVLESSGVPFGDSGCTISSRCDRYTLTVHHGDVWHWLVGRKGETDPSAEVSDANVLAYDVVVDNFPTQGIFTEVFPDDLIGTPVHFDNVAFVDVTISHNLTEGNNSVGGWWEVSTNHLVMLRLNMPTQIMRWNPEKYNTSMSNVAIIDSSFYAFTHKALPEKTIFYNNKFTNPEYYGAFVPPDYHRQVTRGK